MMSRKEFIGKFWGLALLPYLLFSVLMARRHARVSTHTQLTIAGTIPEGISFHDGAIGIREGDRLTFLTDRCTHLGCKINHADGGLLVCPCHGSAYSSAGAVHRGPASRGLMPLPHSIDPSTGTITVNLEP